MRAAAVVFASSVMMMMLSAGALRAVTRRVGRVVRLGSTAADSWQGAGLGPRVSAAAARVWASPNVLQRASLETVLAGHDVVIGSETGSGKTLAYLLPTVERVLRERAAAGDAEETRRFPVALVLVPNRELGTQVARVGAQLGARTQQPFSADAVAQGALTSVAARHGGGSSSWPYARGGCPEILVATPSFVAPLDKELMFWDALRVLVLDEADMLLDGGYLTAIERILVALKRVERQRDRLNMAEADQAAKRCQRCIVAATLPNYGLLSVDRLVQKHFRGAVKIKALDGSDIPMHTPVTTLDHTFLQVSDAMPAKLKRLVDVVKGSSSAADSTKVARTMVFANTAKAVVEACEALERAGLRASSYHKNVLPVKRLEALEAFATGEVDVLVCTDLASRGLDLPLVDHVIQLEFALSVVSHLHRIGRAARAGASGKATSFHDASNADLVASILASETAEGSFSRRRGFRKKLRKKAKREEEGVLRDDADDDDDNDDDDDDAAVEAPGTRLL